MRPRAVIFDLWETLIDWDREANAAMLAKAARRPAQCRTTRSQTAAPTTTQVNRPHTTCALSTWTPPAKRSA